jgi:RNA polymerase sigma factor (sigma-70 family)
MRPSSRRQSLALARLCQSEVLGPEEERRLFRDLQQARKPPKRLKVSPRGPTANAKAATSCSATTIRNRIALSNLRLVVSVAKRFASPQQSLEDLVSEASVLLLHCVERFDPARGTRFSTYATRALVHHFVRLQNRERRLRLRTLSAMHFDRAPMHSAPSDVVDRLIHHEDLNRLNEKFHAIPRRERALLAGRFGLKQNAVPRTYSELGLEHGLSKEWARVTTTGVLERLRRLLDDECS